MTRAARAARQLIFVDRRSDGLRLDHLLQAALSPLSRNRIKALLDQGRVRIDGRIERHAGQPVRAGSLLEVAGLPAVPEVPAVLEDRRILRVDRHLIAVDKPAGLSMHAVEAGDERHLVAAVRAWAARSGIDIEEGGPFIASRLDRDTSGVVVMGLTREAGRALTELFSGRNVRKVYRARVHGEAPARGCIDAPIGAAGQGRFRVDEAGKPAVTRFRRVDDREGDDVEHPLTQGVWKVDGRDGDDASHPLIPGVRGLDGAGIETDLEVLPETGRSHQIRVHLASIGHPLVGDLIYGGHRRAGVTRALLHAARLELVHPITGAALSLEAVLPEDMRLPDDPIATGAAPF